MRTDFLCTFVLRIASGPRVKLASCKSALTPSPTSGYSTDRSKAVVPVLVLLFVALGVYSTRRFVLSLALCYFVLVFFSPFSCAINSLGEERANHSAFRTFVQFALVWFCLFPLLLRVWEGLRLVTVDFSLTFFETLVRSTSRQTLEHSIDYQPILKLHHVRTI